MTQPSQSSLTVPVKFQQDFYLARIDYHSTLSSLSPYSLIEKPAVLVLLDPVLKTNRASYEIRTVESWPKRMKITTKGPRFQENKFFFYTGNSDAEWSAFCTRALYSIKAPEFPDDPGSPLYVPCFLLFTCSA
jgi:hypothetical protein